MAFPAKDGTKFTNKSSQQSHDAMSSAPPPAAIRAGMLVALLPSNPTPKPCNAFRFFSKRAIRLMM